jgi:hypothetical protein
LNRHLIYELNSSYPGLTNKQKYGASQTDLKLHYDIFKRFVFKYMQVQLS